MPGPQSGHKWLKAESRKREESGRCAGRMIAAGRITSGMKMGFHLLRRAGYSEESMVDVARVIDYFAAFDLHRDALETVEIG